jgi:hypothetical protein
MAYSNFYDHFYVIRKQTSSALAAVWRFPSSRLYFLIIGLLQLAAWLEAIFIYRQLSGDLVVLHYNVDFGIDLVGTPTRIFIYPFFGLGIFLLNLGLAAALNTQRDFRIFIHLLLSAALIFGLFLNLALLFVYLINFR